MIKIYNRDAVPTDIELTNIVKFLFTHLGEFGDPQYDIEKAVKYVFDETTPGGTIITSSDWQTLTGVTVLNRTGMKGYIPGNILVYIATHLDHRGEGIGTTLMNKAIEVSEGDIALHVEPGNPAKKLYEKLGFTNKYLEMRFKKDI